MRPETCGKVGLSAGLTLLATCTLLSLTWHESEHMLVLSAHAPRAPNRAPPRAADPAARSARAAWSSQRARLGRTSLRLFEHAELPAFDAPARAPPPAAATPGGTLDQPARAAPSYLIAVAAYGDGREKVRRLFLRNVGGLCERGLHAALLIDAVVTRPSFWQRALSVRAGHGVEGDGAAAASTWALGPGRWPDAPGDGLELGCSARRSSVQVALRHHERSIGDLLTRQHQPAFWANRLAFDWFAYVEDDLGWTADTFFALQHELRALDALVLAGSPTPRAARAVDAAAAAGGGDFPGLAAAAAGVWTGVVRWEALGGALHLNDPANRSRGLAGVNEVPLDAIAANDLNWRPAAGAVSTVRLGGGAGGGGALYFEPRNPFAASWLLPRPLLLRAWAGGALPDFKSQPRMIKEFYGGCWLLAQRFAVDRRRRHGFARLRKVLPCDGERLRPLLALHLSGSKYTLGPDARHSHVASLADFVARACATAPVAFGSEQWRTLDPDTGRSKWPVSYTHLTLPTKRIV